MTPARTLVLQPTRGWRAIDFGELWAYRELLAIFAWRDLKVRYRQTFLGALWVMGQPLVTMLLFTVIFGRVAKLGVSTDVPYPVFVMAGLVLWNFVSGTIIRGSNSLIGASHLISKIYFPRLVIPIANLVTDFIDFVLAAVLLIPLMIWYHVVPPVQVALLPLAVLLAAIFALGGSLWGAALNIEYRDVRIVIPWIVQIAMYATPVVYPLQALPERYQRIAVFNPMSGIVEAFRSTLFGTPFPRGPLAWSIVASLILLISGAFYFRRVERRFADVL